MADNRRWYLDAACRDTDTELFFGGTAASNKEATKFCGRCPVRAECLEDALEYPPIDQYGVAGGLSAHERSSSLEISRRTEELTASARYAGNHFPRTRTTTKKFTPAHVGRKREGDSPATTPIFAVPGREQS